jgi:hypothetical protein
MNVQDEKQVKAYFLGELAEEDTLNIEMRCFDDEGFAEQAFIVEDELIEAYLDGTLSNEECQHFEDNYLVTSARRTRLELVRNLKSGKLADTKQPAPLAAFSGKKKPLIASPSNWRNRFWNPQFKLGFAVGLGLLLLVLCMGLFRFLTHPNATDVERSKGGGASETDLTSSSPSTNNPPSIAKTAASPEIFNDSDEQPKITNQTIKKPFEKKKDALADLAEKQRTESKTTRQIAFGVILSPGSARDDMVKSQYVNYSPKAKFTQINLSEVEVNRPTARIELQTAEGKMVWQKANLKVQKWADGKKYVTVQIPREYLSEQTFVVVLYDREEQIADYVFRAKIK